MKILLLALIVVVNHVISWQGDFEAARKEAATSNKLILINFSGSDWCGPCIRLRKEILESADFETYAAKNLVLVRADFPRNKSHQLPADQIKRNEQLADKYNPEGKFPFTLLVNDQGKILRTWDGFPDNTPAQFVANIQTAANDHH